MKLERDGLIGINNWNPIGESLVGIISRVSALNYFSWRDVKITFLTNPKVGRVPLYISIASTIEGIDVSVLKLLFNDQLDICKSYSSYYSPEHGPGISISRRLKICHRCAEVGKHLLLHQLEHLHLCPVHNCRLHDRCVKCGSGIGVFEIPVHQPINKVFNSFTCKKCGHENIDFRNQMTARQSSHYENKLKLFFSDYQMWLRDWEANHRNVDWNSAASDVSSWALAMQLTKKPDSLKKYYKPPITPVFEGKVLYRQEISHELYQQLRNRKCQLNEDPRTTALAVNMYVYADEVLKVFRNSFGITDRQISSTKYLRIYKDIFWGQSYSVWTHAYVELEHALSFRFRSTVMLPEGLQTRNWFTECWYHYFAKWLLATTNLKIDCDIVLISRLSRIWLRKFLTQIFADEVLRACNNLLDTPQRTPYTTTVDELDPWFGKYDSLIMKHTNRNGFGEITFWRTGPNIDQLTSLYKDGFRGYTPNKHRNYKNYKRLHKLFGIQGIQYKYDTYTAMLAMHSVVHVEY